MCQSALAHRRHILNNLRLCRRIELAEKKKTINWTDEEELSEI